MIAEMPPHQVDAPLRPLEQAKARGDKVVFADIDGVLIKLPSNGAWDPEARPSIEPINNFNILLQVSRAKLVITSTWRIGRSVRQLDVLLKSWGVKSPVFDKTPEHEGDSDRGKDIAAWLAKREETSPVTAFVVIDDEGADLQPFARHLVMPNPSFGLQFHDVQHALEMLRRESA
jgi:hypothetical protein